MFKKVAMISFLLLVVLAACAAQNTPVSMDANQAIAMATAAPVMNYAANAPAPGVMADGLAMREAAAEPQAQERLVLKTATLTLLVNDTEAVMGTIQTLVAEVGGWIVSSNTSQGTYYGQTALQGNISIRVPAERLETVLAQVKDSAVEVRNESIIGEDVTQQYTDTGSRLRNLEAAETQLQRIMEDARRTEDVLTIYNELVRVRSEIEVLRGQLQYFEQSAAYSLINITLQPNILTQPIQVGGWSLEGTARDAVETLIGAGQFVLSGLVWLAIVGLPLVIVVLVLWHIARMIWRRRTTKATVPAV